MKVVILAGGLGTRISEETTIRPKPMVEIGGKPILWHIMKLYSHYGFHEFIICLGYKGSIIKDYFANYYQEHSDMTIDLKHNTIDYHKTESEPWKITLIDTGPDTFTGGRIKKVLDYIPEDEFMLTYGDGVSNVNIPALLAFHRTHKRLVTVTSVQPEGRFGALSITDNHIVSSFMEKPVGDGGWINAGFFVCSKAIGPYITGNQMWEREPLEKIAEAGELVTFQHTGFWKAMDTLSDRNNLEKFWSEGNPPWFQYPS